MNNDFNASVAALLEELAERIEAADTQAMLDIETQEGVVTIIHEDSGRTLVISRHGPMQQVWLASPLSGGLHFSRADDGNWTLPDGRTLQEVLAAELAEIAKLRVSL